MSTRTSTTSTVRDLEDVVADLPGVERRESWGRPTYRVAHRMFAVVRPDDDAVSVRTAPEEQSALLARDPAVFRRAPYVGRYGWTLVRLDGVDPRELRELVTEAHRRAA